MPTLKRDIRAIDNDVKREALETDKYEIKINIRAIDIRDIGIIQ